MRVFITGGTGFLGSFAVDAFVEDSHDVCVLVRPETDPWRIAGRLNDVTVISGSLDDPRAFADALSAFRPDTVLNIAWTGVSGCAHNDPAQPDNLTRVEELIEVSAAAGAVNWIGLGSQAEYGLCEKAIAEDEPPHPVTAYGKSKLEALHLSRDLCARYGMRFSWIRLFACYGPRDKETWLIPYVIRTLSDGIKPELTEGWQRWDYLFVTDAASALLAIAKTPAAEGVFNLGSGKAVPVRSVVESIRDLIDPSLPLGFGTRALPPDLVMLLEADISRLNKATGWHPGNLNHGRSFTDRGMVSRILRQMTNRIVIYPS